MITNGPGILCNCVVPIVSNGPSTPVEYFVDDLQWARDFSQLQLRWPPMGPVQLVGGRTDGLEWAQHSS